nr:Trk system potassium transporter TrkA [Gammaproteobacteria bacterium]
VAHGDSKHSKVVGRHLNEIKIPKEVFVNAVVRGNKVFLPNEDLVIEEGDHVVLFVRNKKYLSGAEGLFL